MWHRHRLIYQSGYSRRKFICGGFQEFRGHIIKAASFPVVNFLDKRSYFTNRYFIEVKWNILLFIAVYIFHAFVVFVYLKNFIKAFFFRQGRLVSNFHGHSSKVVVKYVTYDRGVIYDFTVLLQRNVVSRFLHFISQKRLDRFPILRWVFYKVFVITSLRKVIFHRNCFQFSYFISSFSVSSWWPGFWARNSIFVTIHISY